MAYTQVSVTGYNANPPSDDGTQASQNEVAWSKHKTKLGDPLKSAIESIDANVKSFSDESPAGQSGTRELFQQTTAPTGWTKETGAGYDDTALRIVTGTVGSETGQQAFSTVFGKTATDAHTLTLAQIPAHDHDFNDPEHTHTYDDPASPTNVSDSVGGAQAVRSTSTQSTGSSSTGITFNSAGGGGSHSHNMDIRINRRDCIVAEKD